MGIKINKTRIVSFPRSGHHWLVRSLQMNLPHMVYLEHYCDGRTLVDTPEAHVRKSHDFDLTLEKNPDYRHVVMRRVNMWDAIESWHAMPENSGLDKSKFIDEKVGFAADWMTKWCSYDVPNSIVVTYEEMCRDIRSVVLKVLRHISDWGDRKEVLFEPFKEGGRHDV